MSSNQDRSYISFGESEAVKGLLMMLIVMGHNMCFTILYEECQLMTYFYQFHIQAFFALPFLYGAKRLDFDRVKKYFARLYIPFIIFSTLLYLGYYVVYQHNHLSLIDVARLWVLGEGYWIKEYTGVQLLWFLPAMFSLSILKDLYYQSSAVLKCVILALSLAFYLALCLLNLYDPKYEIIADIYRWLPFGLAYGLSYLFLGIVVRDVVVLLSKCGIDSLLSRVVLWAAFIGFSVFYFMQVYAKGYIGVITTLMPFVFFLLVYSYKGWLSGIKLLSMIGRQSFPIYIFHAFIGYGLYAIVSRYLGLSVIWALASWLIMLAGSYGIALWFDRHSRLRAFFFPSSIDEFLHTFKRERN